MKVIFVWWESVTETWSVCLSDSKVCEAYSNFREAMEGATLLGCKSHLIRNEIPNASKSNMAAILEVFRKKKSETAIPMMFQIIVGINPWTPE